MAYISTLETPIGRLVIEANENAVHFIGFDVYKFESPNEISELAKLQLQEYFEGNRILFDFPVEQPGTDFQQKVWMELLQINPGYPISYSAFSKKMNIPLAIRAIAAANGRNQLMIIIPCHRVIGKNGDLVGYAGGLWRKKWLLEHEARVMSVGQAQLAF